MTDQNPDAPPPVPNTVGGIRALLSPARLVEFDSAVAALDLADPAAIGKFRSKWWCLAAFDSDPTLLDRIDPDEPLFPSPFKRPPPFQPILRDANARLSRQLRLDGGSIWSADIGDRQLDVLDLTVERADDPPELVAQMLGTTSVVVRDRVYAVDGRRVQWARSFLAAELVAGTRIELEDTEPGGTFARLAEIGYEPVPPFVEDVTFIDAAVVTEEERTKLDLHRAESVVQIVRTNATAEGRVVEVTDMRLVADAYRFRWAFGA